MSEEFEEQNTGSEEPSGSTNAAATEAPVVTLRDGDLSGCARNRIRAESSIQAFRGNNGTSDKAARADHVHPVNVDPDILPPRTGLIAQNQLAQTEIITEKSQNTYGKGGYPAVNSPFCNSYALANHSHGYAYVSKYTKNNADRPLSKAIADGCDEIGAKWMQNGIEEIEKIGGAVGKYADTYREGDAGRSPFPAREDHSHPLNVVDVHEKISEDSIVPAQYYVKATGSGKDDTGANSPSQANHGESPYYARVDHVHPICTDCGKVSESAVSMQGHKLPTGLTLDNTEWTPGDDGLVEICLSRIVRGSDIGAIQSFLYWIFRKKKYSRTGALVWRGPEFVGIVTQRPNGASDES